MDYLGEEDHRGKGKVPFSLYHIKDTCYQHDLFTVDTDFDHLAEGAFISHTLFFSFFNGRALYLLTIQSVDHGAAASTS